MRRASTLLSMFLGLLSARGLAPECLDPWRAWVVFKHYARLVDEVPDPGISVQVQRHQRSGHATVYMLRQVLEPAGEDLHPIGGVVCELTFARPSATTRDFEAWSFDHADFERFVDVVEGDAGFADLLGQRPISSTVYWEDA